MTLDQCTVNCDNLWLTLYSGSGDVKISGSTVTIDNTTAGLYFRGGNTVYGVFCNARSPGDKKIEIIGGEFSL